MNEEDRFYMGTIKKPRDEFFQDLKNKANIPLVEEEVVMGDETIKTVHIQCPSCGKPMYEQYIQAQGKNGPFVFGTVSCIPCNGDFYMTPEFRKMKHISPEDELTEEQENKLRNWFSIYIKKDLAIMNQKYMELKRHFGGEQARKRPREGDDLEEQVEILKGICRQLNVQVSGLYDRVGALERKTGALE